VIISQLTAIFSLPHPPGALANSPETLDAVSHTRSLPHPSYNQGACRTIFAGWAKRRFGCIPAGRATLPMPAAQPEPATIQLASGCRALPPPMSPSQSQRPSNWPPAARLLHQRRRPAGVRGRPTSLWQKAGHATGEGVGGALVYQVGFTTHMLIRPPTTLICHLQLSEM
jgi:hypothetical protein